MAMIQAASTAQILETPAHLSGADFAPSGTRWGRFDPLGWLVDLTEAAQVRLARAALAQGLPVDSSESGRFSNDAAGGGSRAIEAARSLHVRADLR